MLDREATDLVRALPAAAADEIGGPGLAQLRAILTGPWFWSPACVLPGGEATAEHLGRLGWASLWPDHPSGLHVTLSLRAERALGVAVVEQPAVSWRAERKDELESLGPAPDRIIGPVSVDELQFYDRWAPLEQLRDLERRHVGCPMPRTRKMAPLPYPDLVPAPIRAPEPEPVPFPDAVQEQARELILLGIVADRLRARPRKKAKATRKRASRPVS